MKDLLKAATALFIGLTAAILIASTAELYGYVNGRTRYENGVIVSAGKVHLMSLSAVVYSRDVSFSRDVIYESIHVYKPIFGKDLDFYYENGKLYRAEVCNNNIYEQRLLQEIDNKERNLLLTTRQAFLDVMPSK